MDNHQGVPQAQREGQAAQPAGLRDRQALYPVVLVLQAGMSDTLWQAMSGYGDTWLTAVIWLWQPQSSSVLIIAARASRLLECS